MKTTSPIISACLAVPFVQLVPFAMFALCITYPLATWSQLTYACEVDDTWLGTSAMSLGPGPCATTRFDYFPDEETYMFGVKVNFHFMLNSGGGGNFTTLGDNIGGTYNGFNYVTELVDKGNDFLSSNAQMNLPPGNTTAVLPRRYEVIVSGVYYHEDDNLFTYAQTQGSMSTVMAAYGVNVGSEVNVFFVSNGYAPIGPVGNTGKATTTGDRWILIQGAWQNYAYLGGFPNVNEQARLFIHEFGHTLSLPHTMLTSQGACNQFIDDGFADTPTIDEMLALGQPNPCCPDYLSTCSNNLMDYNPFKVLTPERLGAVHRTLISNMLPYVVQDYCYYDNARTISVEAGESPVWTGAKILTGDLIVRSGGQLTVKCWVHLPDEGRVIVEPGGS